MNWTHVTTVAWASSIDFICEAHSHGARAILSAPSIVFTDNATEREEWAEKALSMVTASFADGVTFDFESALPAHSANVSRYTELVKATRDAFHAKNPSLQVSVCVGWSPDAIDGRAYDYKGLADASDLLYVSEFLLRWL